MSRRLLRTSRTKVEMEFEAEVPEVAITPNGDMKEPSTSPLDEADMEVEEDEIIATPSTSKSKPSILTLSKGSKKRSSYGSGKRKAKRLPCNVCSGRFGSQVALDEHIKRHWHVYYKFEELLYNITNKVIDKKPFYNPCDCPRCKFNSKESYEYDPSNRFVCQMCDEGFVSANKLSKHMDKHRNYYYKMKEMIERNELNENMKALQCL